MLARIILTVLLSMSVSSLAAAQTQREGQTLGAKPPAPSGAGPEAETNSYTGWKGSSQPTCEGQADEQSLRGKKRKAFLKKCNAPQ